MKKAFLASAAVLVLAVAGARTGEAAVLDDEAVAVARQLQAAALEDDLAWRLVESLTTEVGPRPGGSAGDARAVAWAERTFRELGFDRVRKEPVRFPRWRRGEESGAILSPWAQPLVLTAIGGSPGTDGPLEGEVVAFESVADLEAADAAAVAGRIVLLTRRQERARTGAGYGRTAPNRTRGPFAAGEKGALALLLRSAGTNPERLAHTGTMATDDTRPRVPAAAVSQADADQLERMLAGGAPVRVRLDLDCGFDGEAVSYNVIGEYDGTDPGAGWVLAGAHLDSWDLGTGAVDDGAGVAITMAAATHVARGAPRPARGLRVVLFANEEEGVYGGKAYAAEHGGALDTHLVGAESDLGAGRVWMLRTRVDAAAEPWVAQLAALLAPLGIERTTRIPAFGGADWGPMRLLGMPVIDLAQDATRYFDWHHTASDTLDKIDPADLRQNVAAWVTLLWAAARSDVRFGPLPASAVTGP